MPAARHGEGMRSHIRAVAIGAGVAALLLLGGLPLPAASQESQALKTDVVVLVSPVQKDDDKFRQFISEAAQYKLQKLGLRTQIISASAGEADKPRPQEHGAAAALVCRYGMEGGQMHLTLGWYDAKTGPSSTTVQAAGDADLNLDSVVLAALDQMFAQVHDQIQTMSAHSAADAAPPTPAAVGSPNTVIVVAPSRQAGALPLRHLLFSGGFAPFVPTGAASYYFSLGYLPSVLASYFVDTPVGPVGLGLYIGTDFFTATGSQDYASTYVFPLGLDIRYELGSAFLRPYFHVAAGPALFVMATGTQGTLTSLVPFLKTGIGLDVIVTGGFGLSALADYDVYFEMPYLLMGFAPSINMELRL